MYADSMLDLGFSQIVQGRRPCTHLIQYVGHGFRDQNVPCIPAVHHPLRDVDPTACHISCGIYVLHPIDRSSVNSHPQVNLRPPP